MSVIQVFELNDADGSRVRSASQLVSSHPGAPKDAAVGTHIKDPKVTQIILDRPDVDPRQEHALGEPEHLKPVLDMVGNSDRVYYVALDRPAFGPATANVVENVQVDFPASRVTPEFKQQIAADFDRFDRLFMEEAKPHRGFAIGWVLQQDKRGSEGDNLKSFFVVRGWNSHEDFESSTQIKAYKEAVPILLAWRASFKMVSLA